MLVILLLLLNASYSFGSGQMACSSFVSADGRAFQLGEAYQSADLVVIGQVVYGTKPMLKIKTKIKGVEKANEIELTPSHCQGTACSGGFSVAPKVDLLFLLSHQKNGLYDSVTGNGNYSCPVVYEVEKDIVNFRNKKIPVKSLEKYFQSKPDPVPLY